MIQSPKMHWSTKVILGLFLLLAILLSILWFGKQNQIPWINQFFENQLLKAETPTPTISLKPSPTKQAFPAGTPIVTAIGMTSIYSGPAETFEVIALLEPGQQARVEGISEDSAWWAIDIPYLVSGRGWVQSELVLAENTLNAREISADEQLAGEEANTIKGKALTNVNIRSGPGMNFQKMDTLEIDQEATILGKDPEGFWYLIEIPGVREEQGWVSVDYVAAQNTDTLPVVRYQPPNANPDVPPPEADEPALMSLAVVNIRSGPDIIYETLGKLEVGQQAVVLGVSADGRWYAIEYVPADSGRAWVAADFVEVNADEEIPVLP